MKALVIIDSWKLEIYTRFLLEAMEDRDILSFHIGPGMFSDTLSISIWTDDIGVLNDVLRGAHEESTARVRGALH